MVSVGTLAEALTTISVFSKILSHSPVYLILNVPVERECTRFNF